MKKSLIKLAAELDFQYEYEYFEYMVDSHVLGNFSQCRDLFKDMSIKDRKSFIEYIQNSNHASESLNDMYQFYIDLAIQTGLNKK